jgi:hypothetical protein
MFNYLISSEFKSFYSPKVGGASEIPTESIKVLDTLSLSGDKTLIVLSKTNSSILSIEYPNLDSLSLQIIKYYGKILENESPVGEIQQNSFVIDTSLLSTNTFVGNDPSLISLSYTGSPEQLTYAVKSQIIGEDRFMIVWLKSELEFQELEYNVSLPNFSVFSPSDPPRLRLKSLHGQIFDFNGQKVGEKFSKNLEDMDWDLKNLSDYTINSLDLYSPA